MKKMSVGFFIMFAAIVVGIVGIIIYGGAYVTSKPAYHYMIAAAVVGAISEAGALKMPKIFNWGAPVAACLAAAGFAYSFTVMTYPIGYVISGLYASSTLTGYIIFAVVALISLLLYLIAGFTGMAKES